MKTTPIISIVGGAKPEILAVRKLARTIRWATAVNLTDSRASAR